MTPNMSKFIKKNKTHKIVSGGHVTSEGKPIKKVSESAGVNYVFTDDSTMTVWREDALSSPAFNPVWDL